MKSIPMIFNTAMVQALLDGRKVQTRRPVAFPVRFSSKTGFSFMDKLEKWWACGIGFSHSETVRNFVKSKSPWRTGDLIWVRETFGIVSEECGEYSEVYKADNGLHPKKWSPSIHMPRELNRITLKVTGVRVERVQDISEDDAIAEGFKLPAVEGQGFAIGARTNFRHAWEQIYGDHWKNNGWCWVVDFEVIQANVDAVIKELEAA